MKLYINKIPSGYRVRIALTSGSARRFVSCGVYASKAEAEIAGAKALGRLASGVTDPVTRSVWEVAEDWLEAVTPRLRVTTAIQYRRNLDLHLRTAPLAALPAAGVSVGDIRRYLESLRAQRGIAHAMRSILNQVFSHGVENGWVPANPVQVKVKQGTRKRHLPTQEQVVEIIESFAQDQPQMSALVWLLAATAMRRSEALALRWDDLKGDQLRVARTLSYLGGGEWGEAVTKTGEERLLTLDPRTLSVLEGLPKDGPFIFGGTRPWSPTAVSTAYTSRAKSLGVKGHTLHALRHFTITHLIAGGAPVNQVASWVGHRSVQTTLNIYSAHAVDAYIATLTERAARQIGHAGEGATNALGQGRDDPRPVRASNAASNGERWDDLPAVDHGSPGEAGR